jgi:hypothetical protein
MGFLQQRPNRIIPAIVVLCIGVLFCFLPAASRADAILYEPEVDVSMSLYMPIINETDVAPDIRNGLFFGGYFSRKNRFFTDYFNAEKLYSIIETGVALNPIEGESTTFVTIPVHYNVAYQLPLFGKLSFMPFIGTGFHITYNDYLEDSSYRDSFKDHPHINMLLASGFELRWAVLKYGALRLKIDYGLIFDGRVESGYMQYLQIRFPLPLIP